MNYNLKNKDILDKYNNLFDNEDDQLNSLSNNKKDNIHNIKEA